MCNSFNECIQDAVIYARYSGGGNQRDCSIEQQVADCETYARHNNLRIIKIYADHALSGTNDKRPQFQQMLRDAAHGKWKYVICWKIDRFARNRYDSATYKFRLKKNGVSVLYAKESIPDGPEGILLESILEGSAEYYSANLAQNVRRGMMFNAQQCKVNSGNLPFGYAKGSDGKFALNPAQADVVREIFSKFLEGYSFAELANDLNSRGIRTARGNRWNKNSFHAMLKNESYIGIYHYSDIRVEGGMPSIISTEQFAEVQRRLATKKNPQGRHRDKGEYLLTGKLKCGHCDAYMVGLSGTGKHGELHYYYGCQNHFKSKTCNKRNVPRDWIERLVVKSTLDYVLQDEVIQWMADSVMEFQRRESSSAQLESLIAESASVEKAIGNVMTAIEAGIITPTTKSRLLELEAKAEELSRLISAEKAANVPIERDQIIYWLSKFKGGNLESKEFRRRVIDTFVTVVYLTDDKLRIGFNYTGKPSTADFSITWNDLTPTPEGSDKLSYTLPKERHQMGASLFCFPALAIKKRHSGEVPLSWCYGHTAKARLFIIRRWGVTSCWAPPWG